MKRHIAIDQYGNYTFLGEHPRKELLEECSSKHADKMYTEYKDGTSKHTGYVIGGRWFRVFRLEDPFEKG